MCVYVIMLICVCILCYYVYSVKSSRELVFIVIQKPNSNKVFLSYLILILCSGVHRIVLCFWVVFLSCVPYVASFSGLSVYDCPFRYSLTFVIPPQRSCRGVYWFHHVRPAVRLSVRPSVRPSVCLSVCLSVCPSVRLSVCLSVCPSVRLSVCPAVRL